MHRANGRPQVQDTIAEHANAPFVKIPTIQRTRLSIDRHNHGLITGREGYASKSRF